MPKIWIQRQQFQDGDLPGICVVSGAPADRVIQARFNSLPEWTWILLLFGVLPFLVAAGFAKEQVVGRIPITQDVVRRYHRRKRASWVTFGLALTFIAVGILTSATTLVWTGIVTVAVATLIGILAFLGFVDGRPDRSGERIKLTRVHPRFVAAVRAQPKRTPEQND